MLTGILWGLCAALLNSIGYLFGAVYLRHYHSPVRLLLLAHFAMLLMGIPCLLLFFPFGRLTDPGIYVATLFGGGAAFVIGQLSFFMALRYLEASRLASLLGLKIIVLTVIVSCASRELPGVGRSCAVLLAAFAAMVINWNGSSLRIDWRGMFFVLLTLIFYSLCDILEARLVRHLILCGGSPLRSAIAAVASNYSMLGVVMLPGVCFIRITRRQLLRSVPYGMLWFGAQAALLCCFAAIQTVFGNVILASRGLFSVLLGAGLAYFGFARCDAVLSARQWALRGLGALLMIAAIALYSFSA